MRVHLGLSSFPCGNNLFSILSLLSLLFNGPLLRFPFLLLYLPLPSFQLMSHLLFLVGSSFPLQLQEFGLLFPTPLDTHDLRKRDLVFSVFLIFDLKPDAVLWPPIERFSKRGGEG